MLDGEIPLLEDRGGEREADLVEQQIQRRLRDAAHQPHVQGEQAGSEAGGEPDRDVDEQHCQAGHQPKGLDLPLKLRGQCMHHELPEGLLLDPVRVLQPGQGTCIAQAQHLVCDMPKAAAYAGVRTAGMEIAVAFGNTVNPSAGTQKLLSLEVDLLYTEYECVPVAWETWQLFREYMPDCKTFSLVRACASIQS